MKNKPFVGQKVHLNNEGIEIIYGTSLGLSHMKTLVMTIIDVDDESMTFPENTWIVQVDNPEINIYMLSNWDFDPA